LPQLLELLKLAGGKSYFSSRINEKMILKFVAKLANLAGLATIVGACATGLILEHFIDRELQRFSLTDTLSPIKPLITQEVGSAVAKRCVQTFVYRL
jgi:hypothetical protein